MPWKPGLLSFKEATGGFEPPNEGFAAPYAPFAHPYSTFRQLRLRVCFENWRFVEGTFTVLAVPVNRRNEYK
jgi:hypothetical protein